MWINTDRNIRVLMLNTLTNRLSLIVGEPKSRISKKTLTLAPRGIRLNFCIWNAITLVDMKPLYMYSNATRIAFRRKHAFGMGSRLAL